MPLNEDSVPDPIWTISRFCGSPARWVDGTHIVALTVHPYTQRIVELRARYDDEEPASWVVQFYEHDYPYAEGDGPGAGRLAGQRSARLTDVLVEAWSLLRENHLDSRY